MKLAQKKKDKIKEVSSTWEVYVEPSYFLSVPCPHCKKKLSNWEIHETRGFFTGTSIDEEGQKINKIVSCGNWDKKFKLKVPQAD